MRFLFEGQYFSKVTSKPRGDFGIKEIGDRYIEENGFVQGIIEGIHCRLRVKVAEGREPVKLIKKRTDAIVVGFAKIMESMVAATSGNRLVIGNFNTQRWVVRVSRYNRIKGFFHCQIVDVRKNKAKNGIIRVTYTVVTL